MPLYEYECRDCGQEFEELVSINSEETPPCPECGSTHVEKQMSLFGRAGGKGEGGTSGNSTGFT